MSNLNIAYAEHSILSHILHYPSQLLQVEDKFFVSEPAKIIFGAIKTLLENNVEINNHNIVLETSQKDDSIREDHIEKIRSVEADENAFDFLYKTLRTAKAQYNIQNDLAEGLLKESARKEINIERVKEFRDALTENLEEIEGKDKVLIDTRTWLDLYATDLNRRRSGLSFYSTGDGELDSLLTTAFEPGYFNILAGHSGIGKSSFALMLNNKQLNRQIPSLRISNEMTAISDMDRLIAQRNRIPIRLLYPHRGDEEGIPDHIFQTLEQERNKIGKAKFFRYAYLPSGSLDDVEMLIKKAKAEMGVKYIAVTIDLLTKLDDFSGDNKASRYEDSVNKLDTLAKRTNSSILGIVQLRRPSDKVIVKCEEDLEKFRPEIQEIKNAGALEERARIVMTIFRKRFWAEKYFKSDPLLAPLLEIIDNVAEIDILKQNLGFVGVQSKYLFDGECASFANYVENNG
jgi:replicative DNA helicase